MSLVIVGHSTDPNAQQHQVLRAYHNPVCLFFLTRNQLKFRHIDSDALAFIRQINSLFISNDVNLCLDRHHGYEPRKDLPNLRAVLDHLAPMLNGIQSISIEPCLIPLVEQYFTAKLPQLKMLTIDFGFGHGLTDQQAQASIQTSINFCLNWLTSGQRDTPKILQMKAMDYDDAIVRQCSKAVQQVYL